MDPSINGESIAPKRTSRMPIVLGIVVLLLLGCGYLYVNGLIPSFFGTLGPKISSPTGHIYISIAPISDKSSYLGVFVVDPQKGSLTPVLDTTDRVDHLTPSVSPDGTTLALVEITNGKSSISISKPFTSPLSPIQITKRLATSNYPEFPVWSPAGKQVVVYGAITEKNEEQPLNPLNWLVYEMNLSSGKERFITDGAYPTYVAPNKLIVLKKGGLYIVDPTSNNAPGTLLWNVDGNTLTNMTYAVTPDKKTILWTFPGQKKVYALSVSSWDPVRAVLSVFLEEELYMPRISPDGMYAAFLKKGTDPARGGSLVVYDISTKKLVSSIDLSSYYPDGTFISDWK